MKDEEVWKLVEVLPSSENRKLKNWICNFCKEKFERKGVDKVINHLYHTNKGGIHSCKVKNLSEEGVEELAEEQVQQEPVIELPMLAGQSWNSTTWADTDLPDWEEAYDLWKPWLDTPPAARVQEKVQVHVQQEKLQQTGQEVTELLTWEQQLEANNKVADSFLKNSPTPDDEDKDIDIDDEDSELKKKAEWLKELKREMEQVNKEMAELLKKKEERKAKRQKTKEG